MDCMPQNGEGVASKLIGMAVYLVGKAHVMAYMRCSEDNFRDYCDARKSPPQPDVERLIELILREQNKIIAKYRELLARNSGN
jgi:hypothetical protein